MHSGSIQEGSALTATSLNPPQWDVQSKTWQELSRLEDMKKAAGKLNTAVVSIL